MRRALLATLLVLWCGLPATAQTTQVWPELGVFSKLSDSMRIYFIATTVKEHAESTESEVGPNVDFYLRPVTHPKTFGGLRLDESKARQLMVRVGYRYLNSFSDSPDEHRAVLEATGRYPLASGVLVSNRGRMDLRFIDGAYSWRFRNRLSFEKELSAGPVHMTPYLRNELYYDSRIDEWSRIEWIGGAAFPIRRHFELEGYFSYQNDSSGDANRQNYAIGTVLNLYF